MAMFTSYEIPQEKFKQIKVNSIPYSAVGIDENNHLVLLGARYNVNPHGVLYVAVLTLTKNDFDKRGNAIVIDWAAYIGIIPSEYEDDIYNAAMTVANRGNKLSKSDAEHYFPWLFDRGFWYRE